MGMYLGYPFRPSSGYGMRNIDRNGDGIPDGPSMHYGLDFAAPQGTPIPTLSNGSIYEVDFSPTYGNYVVVEHYDVNGNVAGYTLYAHMNEQSNKNVGDPVKKGDTIGEVGMTGASTGYHLHVEVRSVESGIPIPTDINGDGVIDWEDYAPVDPITFDWGSIGGVYNWFVDFFGKDSIIDPSFNRYFTRATQWRPSADPLTLDLDGDGIETVGIKRSGQLSAISYQLKKNFLS